MLYFQDMITALCAYWAKHGCAIHQGHDLEVGAGTFNPATFLRCLGPEPYAAVYVEPTRRPSDGRFGENPNRVQFYHQLQVVIKPSPTDLMELYLGSLEAIGLQLNEHDIRFVHDDWENPTIGAWGLGWEVWADGMEVTQFTYFQAIGGLPVKPVCGEITYGLERLAMYLQGVDSLFDLKWNESLTYGEIFKRNEWEWSHYNFHEASVDLWLRHFNDFEAEANHLIAKHLPLPAYDFVMKASHAFNMLGARGYLSVTERARYIARIRQLAKAVAESYLSSREKMGFPLLAQEKTAPLPELPSPSFSMHDPSQTEDFLLEIGCEELPATFVSIGMQGLEQKMRKLLEKQNIDYESLAVYGTPRRLSIVIKNLAAGVAEQIKERKGPSVEAAFDHNNKPTAAAEGFFRSVGLKPTLSQPNVEVRDGYLFAKIVHPPVSTRQVLAQHLAEVILSIEFPKTMRWADLSIYFARPIRWLVALYGQEIIPFVIGNIKSDRQTYGHRQLAPGRLSLTHPREYLCCLEKHFVLADVKQRQALICKELPDNVLSKERVLAQVTHLVEYPFVIKGDFNPTYLQAPKEVLISEMVEHQKYFPVADDQGNLLPYFYIVSNNRPSSLIKHGHEKALSPRLADGVFLYEEDLKTPLVKFNEALKRMTYQANIGSIWTKVCRIQQIAKFLHAQFQLTDSQTLERAALLCKADLATLLVGEFPDLQGIIGTVYALKQNESEEVASAIDEHWLPKGDHDHLPHTGAGILLSLADKIDNLICCFALDLKPTSSSDPHALRRQALAIHKILIQNKLTLDLPALFNQAFEIFLTNPELDSASKQKALQQKELILGDLFSFLTARLRTILGEVICEKDEIEAVLSIHESKNPYDSSLILEALHTLRQDKEFADLLEVDTRTKKILRSQQHLQSPYQLVEKLIQHPAEKHLLACLLNLKPSFFNHVQHKHYKEAFCLLTQLKEPIATFFEQVKVIDDNEQLRDNRLALLQQVNDLCKHLADLNKLNRS